MDLTDLQVELRSIEEHVASLQTEIEKMKPKTGKEQKEDFEKITRIAKQSPLKNTEVSRVDEVIQKGYIRCLSWLIINSEGELYSKLLYLSRIEAGCKENVSAEQIYQSGLEFETDDMVRMCADFQELKYPFLVDAMILANLSGQFDKKVFVMISELALLLRCDKEELKVIATVAKAVLTMDYDVLRDIPVSKDKKWNGQFSQYISKKWIETQRICCGELRVFSKGRKQVDGTELNGGLGDYIVEECLKNETLVQKNDLIMSGRIKSPISLCRLMEMSLNERKNSIKLNSPYNGMVCFVKDEKREKYAGEFSTKEYIYVVSQFDTYDALCEWHKQENKKEGRIIENDFSEL